MGIPELPKDAKQLAADHQSLLQKLIDAQSISGNLAATVKENTEVLLAEQVMAILRDIPAEGKTMDTKIEEILGLTGHISGN